MTTQSSALGGDLEGQVDTTSTQTADTSSQETTEFVGPEWAKGMELDPDIAKDPTLKVFKDVPSLVKSYVHARKQMGDKVVMPTKNSTKEEWMQFYGRLGMPLEFDKYDFEKPQDASFDEEFNKQFKQIAYENNLLPNQAKSVYDFINKQTSDRVSRIEADEKTAIESAMNNLKQEWGDAYTQNLRQAKLAVKEFGGEEFVKYLNDSGLGNDATLIKIFAKVGKEYFKEDNFTQESKPSYALSPDDAKQRINQYMADKNGPYLNGSHPDHKRAVEEVGKLYEVIAAAQRKGA